MMAAALERHNESAKRIRLGVVGCGAFASLYHLPTLQSESRVRLAVICDPSPGEVTRRAAADGEIPLVASPEEVWPACDAVLISSPHGLHYAHASAAIAAGKHVLVDKPFVMRSGEARELAEAARARGVVAVVAFNRRFDPGCLRARDILDAGHLGPIRHIETIQLGYPRQGWLQDPGLGGGGPFVGRGAHMTDLVPWLTGRRPRRVRGRVLPGEPGQVDQGGSIECDFEVFSCHLTVLAQGLYMWDEVRLFGEDGLVELRRPMGQPLGWAMVRHDVQGREIERVPADEARGRATINFLDALQGAATPACSFEEAWLSVRIVEAAYQSAERQGDWVEL
jgi:predicted dehydrogenase